MSWCFILIMVPRHLFVVTFTLCVFLNTFDCIEWDALVDRMYPKACSRDKIFEQMIEPSLQSIFPTVSKLEAHTFVKQGNRLLKNMEDIDQTATRTNFPTIAMHHFFTSTLPSEAKIASAASRTNLMATKIMLNRKITCGQMTPNTFDAFLESNNFFGLSNKKFTSSVFNKVNIPYRTLDGSSNNINNPLWGAVNQPFTRITPYNYRDGIYSMPISISGRPLPSPRTISAKITNGPLVYSKALTAMSVFWGQLVAHDLSMRTMEQHADGGGIQCCSIDGSQLLKGNSLHPACAPIDVSPDDPFYSQYRVLYLNYVRSLTVPNTKDTLGPAEQMNAVSSYLDCSPIYGCDVDTIYQLRAHIGGQLRATKYGYPPAVYNASSLCDTSQGYCPCYFTGDKRVNQTPGLAALQILLLREHNRLARVLSVLNNHWDDEKVFQEARKILIAEVQHITYKEWLPLILGDNYIKEFGISPQQTYSYDYDAETNAGVINTFAGAAFRFFHSLIPGEITLILEDNEEPITARLSDLYMKPYILDHDNKAVDGVIKGAVRQPAMEAGTSITPEVTNLLFKSTKQWGLDLLAIDIQRGRDHGLATYNTVRSICGLRKAESFEELGNEISSERITLLKSLYDSVDDIDLFIGGLLETNIGGSLLGPTFQCLVGEQFYRTRVGDRYFYDVGDMPHSFTAGQINEITKSSMARLICDNCHVRQIQKHPFQTLGGSNPEYSSDDFNNIPQVDLQHWREF